jgi:hypothetical protein
LSENACADGSVLGDQGIGGWLADPPVDGKETVGWRYLLMRITIISYVSKHFNRKEFMQSD